MVFRYDPTWDADDGRFLIMDCCDGGDYVEYEDYAALQQENERLKAERTEIAARAVEQFAELYAFSHGKVWQLQAHATKIRNGEIEL